MPSARLPEPLDRLVVWTDANLGAYEVPRLLRSAGLHIKTHEEIYPQHGRNPPSDVEWIKMTGRKKWASFTGDKSIAAYRNFEQREAIQQYNARVFYITIAEAAADQKAGRFLNNLERIARACLEPPPGCWRVEPDRVVRVL